MFVKHVLVLGFLTGVAACSASAQTIEINRENKTIAISTTDEATATADIAAVTVGFEIYGAEAERTYREAGVLSQKILAAVRKVGVDDKNIESSAQGSAQERCDR